MSEKELPEHILEYRELGEKFPVTVERAYKTDPSGSVVDAAESDFLDMLHNNYPALAGLLRKENGGAWEILDDRLFQMSLGFREVFVNALYHGNLAVKKHDGQGLHELAAEKLAGPELTEQEKQAMLDRQVIVRFVLEKDGWEVVISDEGNGFQPQHIPDFRSKENTMRHQGRGVGLLTDFGWDVVESKNTGVGEVVRMRWKLAQ